MALMNPSPIMDVSPWPRGRGFSGGSAWWDYVQGQDEQKRLDNLMGVALLDQDVCDRLLSARDESLLEAFGLSEETRSWLRKLQPTSLVDLAQAIVSRS